MQKNVLLIRLKSQVVEKPVTINTFMRKCDIVAIGRRKVL